ncbi:hypothetical protein JKP88DRAFT_245224 [Tribonema minus]|uniref:PARP-type domain-containing protein n=1 Tax=Tribonema minus TaxID=303371 RepID=A0A835Z5J2_9STRA|nr:hypothetical protein JKP88DRAFT_245224 [Tribonema minus]
MAEYPPVEELQRYDFAVDRAKSSRAHCFRMPCERSRKHGKFIPAGVARFAVKIPEENINQFYCLRPGCISKAHAENVLNSGKYTSFADIPGMSQLPDDMRDAAVKCFQCMKDGQELDPALLPALEQRYPSTQEKRRLKAAAKREEQQAQAESKEAGSAEKATRKRKAPAEPEKGSADEGASKRTAGARSRARSGKGAAEKGVRARKASSSAVEVEVGTRKKQPAARTTMTRSQAAAARRPSRSRGKRKAAS